MNQSLDRLSSAKALEWRNERFKPPGVWQNTESRSRGFQMSTPTPCSVGHGQVGEVPSFLAEMTSATQIWPVGFSSGTPQSGPHAGTSHLSEAVGCSQGRDHCLLRFCSSSNMGSTSYTVDNIAGLDGQPSWNYEARLSHIPNGALNDHRCPSYQGFVLDATSPPGKKGGLAQEQTPTVTPCVSVGGQGSGLQTTCSSSLSPRYTSKHSFGEDVLIFSGCHSLDDTMRMRHRCQFESHNNGSSDHGQTFSAGQAHLPRLSSPQNLELGNFHRPLRSSSAKPVRQTWSWAPNHLASVGGVKPRDGGLCVEDYLRETRLRDTGANATLALSRDQFGASTRAEQAPRTTNSALKGVLLSSFGERARDERGPGGHGHDRRRPDKRGMTHCNATLCSKHPSSDR